jgi:hypothetical protein
MRNPLRVISEQFGTPLFSFFSFSGIRSSFRLIGGTFWPKAHPVAEGTTVNYDLCRQLYRNSGDNAYGAAFAKPIVDLQVGFIGIPTVTIDDASTDINDLLNECITDSWAGELQEMFKDSIRDSKVIVRFRRPDILDPLMTMDEADHYQIECLPPERVDLEYSLHNKNIIERAIVIHRMVIVTDPGDIAEGRQPVSEEHDVVEEITRDRYTYFDQNSGVYLTDMEAPNSWGFVPFLEVWNEWDSALQGGQSDLESVIPFLNAFHDVMAQGLQAHKYHSTPKIKMKLMDVGNFIKNNFPEAWDETTGRIKDGGTVNWSGREIIFFNSEEDGDFLEAKSVLGDTRALLDFLIDCISIASETPEWAFMRVDSGSANSDRNAQTVPFIRKVMRKRISFQRSIQTLCKMALVAYGEIPYSPKVMWEQVRPDDQLVLAQAFQQVIMGLEVAAQRGEISDDTYRETIRQFLPVMASGTIEEKNAIVPPPPVAALPAGSQNGNTPSSGTSSVPVKAGPQGQNE